MSVSPLRVGVGKSGVGKSGHEVFANFICLPRNSEGGFQFYLFLLYGKEQMLLGPPLSFQKPFPSLRRAFRSVFLSSLSLCVLVELCEKW